MRRRAHKAPASRRRWPAHLHCLRYSFCASLFFVGLGVSPLSVSVARTQEITPCAAAPNGGEGDMCTPSYLPQRRRTRQLHREARDAAWAALHRLRAHCQEDDVPMFELLQRAPPPLCDALTFSFSLSFPSPVLPPHVCSSQHHWLLFIRLLVTCVLSTHPPKSLTLHLVSLSRCASLSRDRRDCKLRSLAYVRASAHTHTHTPPGIVRCWCFAHARLHVRCTLAPSPPPLILFSPRIAPPPSHAVVAGRALGEVLRRGCGVCRGEWCYHCCCCCVWHWQAR